MTSGSLSHGDQKVLEVALGLSDRGYVIDNGTIRCHGTREDLQHNEDVRNKYLCV